MKEKIQFRLNLRYVLNSLINYLITYLWKNCIPYFLKVTNTNNYSSLPFLSIPGYPASIPNHMLWIGCVQLPKFASFWTKFQHTFWVPTYNLHYPFPQINLIQIYWWEKIVDPVKCAILATLTQSRVCTKGGSIR